MMTTIAVFWMLLLRLLLTSGGSSSFVGMGNPVHAFSASSLLSSTTKAGARSSLSSTQRINKKRTSSSILLSVSTQKQHQEEPKQSSSNNSTIINDRKQQVEDEAAQQKQPQQPKLGTLRVYGPDANGIVAAFAQLLYGHGCGIVDSEQHTDHFSDIFFQRIHFDYSQMYTDKISLQHGINEVCQRFHMKSELNWGDQKKQVAIMVSKYDHCLWELLLRHNAGELEHCEISLIISNHPDLKQVADAFDIPFHVFSVTKEDKTQIEQEEMELLDKNKIDLVILARYMQIVSDNFCQQYPVINIHHSFLPAFVGGKPYHRAHARGVKLIGATAHYATADLDEGPIIEQDITRISHRDAVNDLLRKGRLLEKNVLVHAVKAHIEDRIIVYNNKCVVFDG